MIKKFIHKLLGKTPAKAPKGKRVELPLSEHGIDLQLVDNNAIRVVQTLTDAGFEAFIVGGAVRDMLLGLRPKDFDVATNATPEETKVLFRRAFIIGRRFRIVHVVFGRGRESDIIEVSTFRAMVDAVAADAVSGNEKTSKHELADKSHAVDSAGRVLRDNVWGPQIDDAARRDFTVNAMYYDPQRQIVVDYHGGIKDAKKKTLRMIGDPATRYREDPVRIIRAVRFAAKLGFSIEAKTRAPIIEMAALLKSVPASRTFDEMIKLLQTGHALASIEELRKQNLIGAGQGIFPILDFVLESQQKHPNRAKFVELALQDTDRRVSEGKTVVPSFMLACMLWHDVLDGWQRLKAQGEPAFPALQQAIDNVFDARIGDISGRGKLAADMRETWQMQTRLDRRVGNSPYTLVEQPRFRAGLDFLKLRAQIDEAEPALSQWWSSFWEADQLERVKLINDAKSVTKQATARNPKNSKSVPETLRPDPVEELVIEPAKKKRRRRRKPTDATVSDAQTPSDDAA
jgi:poly(A) polymerase